MTGCADPQSEDCSVSEDVRGEPTSETEKEDRSFGSCRSGGGHQIFRRTSNPSISSSTISCSLAACGRAKCVIQPWWKRSSFTWESLGKIFYLMTVQCPGRTPPPSVDLFFSIDRIHHSSATVQKYTIPQRVTKTETTMQFFSLVTTIALLLTPTLINAVPQGLNPANSKCQTLDGT